MDSVDWDLVSANRDPYDSGHELDDNNIDPYGSGHEIVDNNSDPYGSGHELVNDCLRSCLCTSAGAEVHGVGAHCRGGNKEIARCTEIGIPASEVA